MVYHNQYSTAINEGEKYAKARGYELDQQEYSNAYLDAFFKPEEGKTKKDSFKLFKNDKEQRKQLHVQIYNRGMKKFELNMYINNKKLMKRNLKLFEEFINESFWSLSKLGDKFDQLLSKELKKIKGCIFYVKGRDLYCNDELLFKINGDKDSVESIVKKVRLKLNESLINEKESYERGCAMLYFESNCTKEVREMIKEEDLYVEEGDVSFGKETEPHCTLLYGFDKKVEANEALKICENFTFEACEAHNISLFESKKYDVLKYDIKGKNIKECNEALSDLPFESDFPDFHPHMTVAYLQPGKGKEYTKMIKESHARLQVNPEKIVYSHPNGKKEEIQVLTEVKENEKDNPCWDGYEMIGMKTKNGKKVPNCVPIDESITESRGPNSFEHYFKNAKKKLSRSGFKIKEVKDTYIKDHTAIVIIYTESGPGGGDNEWIQIFYNTEEERKKIYKEFDIDESVSEGKKDDKKGWYKDKKKWNQARKKLTNVADDNEIWSKNADADIIAFWYDEKDEGWVQK